MSHVTSEEPSADLCLTRIGPAAVSFNVLHSILPSTGWEDFPDVKSKDTVGHRLEPGACVSGNVVRGRQPHWKGHYQGLLASETRSYWALYAHFIPKVGWCWRTLKWMRKRSIWHRGRLFCPRWQIKLLFFFPLLWHWPGKIVASLYL